MGVLQKVAGQILARLRDVNTSQKIALLLGGLLVAVSLVWLAQWAARPEMVPLLDQDLQPEELAQVRAGLELINEPCEVRGNRVYVRATANRQALYAQLLQQDKLPANTSIGFAALVKQSDPWISQAEHERRWTYALQEELKAVLRQFQNVRDARVFLNLNTQRGFSRDPAPKSASVTLIMKSGEAVPRALAIAAARLVAGAVAGLSPQAVQVLDAGGAPALDWEGERDPAGQLARHLAQIEQRYVEKIRWQVPDPKALVSVQVELDNTTRTGRTEQPLKGQPLTEEGTRESTTRTRLFEEPGVRPNVGLVAGGGGTGESQERETSKTENQPGLAVKTESTPAGEVKQVTAAISLSYSYLEGVWRLANPQGAAPTPEQIEQVFQQERTRLVAQIAKLVKPQDEANVAIARYYDTVVAPPGASPAALDEALGLVKHYGPQSALGLLALVSLGLMLRMARKSDTADSFGLELGLPEDAIAAARQAAEDVSDVVATRALRARGGGRGGGGSRDGGGDETEPVQQAAATEGMLVAQEVDPATVQTRKMLDQVAQMVGTDPEVVAGLVEQWVQRNEQYHEGAA